MSCSSNGFSSEAVLTKVASKSTFIEPLIENATFYEYELEGLFGIPDLVIATVNGPERIESVAFEMKLSNWKRALQQAFRYKSFASEAYVVMDDAYVSRASRNIDRFREANIGLVSITQNGGADFWFEPKPEKPYSKRLRESFKRTVFSDVRTESWIESSIRDFQARIDVSDPDWVSAGISCFHTAKMDFPIPTGGRRQIS